MARVRMVCGNCESADVVRDAWAEWDEDNQSWELQQTFDQAYCNSCEAETSLEEEQLPEAPVAQPIPALVEQSKRETATIIGSLRALQNIQQHEAPAPEIMDILTDGGTLKPMDDGEVDALCEKLNLGAD